MEKVKAVKKKGVRVVFCDGTKKEWAFADRWTFEGTSSIWRIAQGQMDLSFVPAQNVKYVEFITR